MPLPAALWNVSTNALEPVPEEEIEDRVREGTHAFGLGIEVPVLDKNGEAWFIPSEDVSNALAQGYQIETAADEKARELREKYASGSWNKIRAFAEEAARSASIGVSDVAFRAFGVEAEALAARKEDLGVGATIAADVLGIGGSLFAPVPGATAGATAKAGLGAVRAIGAPARVVAAGGAAVTKATGAALNVGARTGAARVAARAVEASVGTAVEGAAYSTGMVISEAALGDKELTASRIAGEIGVGALLGGAFGIGGAAVGAGLSKFKGALTEALEPSKLSKAAGESAAKGFGMAGDAKLKKRIQPWADPGEELTAGDLGNYVLNESQAALGGGTIGRTGATGKPVAAVGPATAKKNADTVVDDAIKRMDEFTDSLDDRAGGPKVDLGKEFYNPGVPAEEIAAARNALASADEALLRANAELSDAATMAQADAAHAARQNEQAFAQHEARRNPVAPEYHFTAREQQRIREADAAAAEMLDSAFGRANKSQKALDALRGRVDELTGERAAAQSARDDVMARAQRPRGKMWRLVDDLNDPAQKDLRESVAKKLTEWYEGFRGGPVSFTRAVRHLRVVSEELKNRYGAATVTPAVRRAMEIRAELNRYITDRIRVEAEKVGMKAADWLKAKKDYAWSKEIAEATGKLALRREKAPLISGLDRHLVSLGLGASFIGGASPAWAVSSIAGASIAKAYREYGPQLIAAALDRASKFEFLQRSAAAANKRMLAAATGLTTPGMKKSRLNPAAINFKDQVSRALRSKDPVVGMSREGYPIVRVPVSSLDDVKIEPFSRARTASIEEAYKGGTQGTLPPIRVGFDDEGRRVIVDGQHRLDVARKKGAATIDVEMRQGSPVDEMEAHELFEANLRVIDRLATNPELLADMLDNSLAPIQDVAPHIANSIAMRTVRGLMYLHQEAPRPPKPANALAKPPPVSDMKRAKFEVQLRAINGGPVALLEEAAAGVANPVAVAALDAVDPSGMEYARQGLLDILAKTGGAGLDHDQLVALGVILGAPLATTLEPGVIASLQAVHTQQAAELEQARTRLLDIDLGAESWAGESEAWERRRTA